MVFGLIWFNTFIVPAIAEVAPSFMEIPEANLPAVLIVGFGLSAMLFTLGWLLFGLASLRAKVLPRGAAVLLMVGAVVAFVLPLPFLELPLSVVVLGAALAWMGYAVWTGAGESIQMEQNDKS